MKKQNYLFLKVFIPFLLSFSIIAFLSLFFLDTISKEYEDIRKKDLLHTVKNTYENKINENYRLYKEFIQQISENKEIKKAFLTKDRKKLYSLTKDLYKRLNKNFEITHFYFHNIDKKVFLRVHNKNKHSDLIKRFTLDEAEKEKKDSFGIEFGIYHNLTNRYVSPYYDNGKLIGYLELGEEIDYLSPYLAKTLNAEIFVGIKKELIDINHLKLTSKLKSRIKKYPESSKYYIINSSLQNIDQEYIKLINQESLKVENSLLKDYELGKIKLYDIENNEVGVIFALINTEKTKANLHKQKTKLSGLIFIIAIFLISLYFIHLKKITKKLEKSTESIIKLTNTDQLTSLYNRRYFKNQAYKELNKAIERNKSFSFLMIDIDYFKAYNDTYGHLNGDIVIKKIATILRTSLKRTTDMVFRMGGEEFAVLIIENGKNLSALNIANKLKEEVCNLNIEHKKSIEHKKVTISIGISTKKTTKNLDISSFYKNADSALYLAKKNGRNKIQVFEEI